MYFSHVHEQDVIPSMPAKPEKFQVTGDSDVNLPQSDQPTGSLQPPQMDQSPQVDAPAVQGSLPAQQTVEVVFKYPDGRVETITVVNAESVHHLAKAEQVIPAPHSGSFPLTVKPQK